MRTSSLLLLALVACKHDDAAVPSANGEAARAPGGPPPLAEKAFYRVDLAKPPACTAGSPCQAELVLTALGDYHVNERYPVKLEVDQGDVEGTGAWKRDGEKTGTLALTLKPARPGVARVSGTFKLSVCTEANCEIESPKIAFDVTSK
ncbi:MAG: hypothetical protein ABI867_07615 [Kofleriaceae bacterium]